MRVPDSEIQKAMLALGWHVVDGLLDACDAPKRARLAWAGLGLVWAASWLGYHHYQTQRPKWRMIDYLKDDSHYGS